MRKLALHKIIIVAATVALGTFSIATDALARGGGGGGGHGGGGGGGHFGGGGGAHFGGGGGLHMGGGHIGGAQFGGGHFGGSHIGESSVGAIHLGGASMAGARSSMASAHVSARHVGAGLGTAGGLQAQHTRLHDRTHRHRFARGLGYDAYGYDDDACWDRYSVRLHSHLNWRRR
jgi:hypothetical protein